MGKSANLGQEALAEARAAEAEIRAGRSKGPLHGIPIDIKAVIDVAGHRTTANSRLLPDYLPETDATVVRLLREAHAYERATSWRDGRPDLA